ncbi:hypothetical protein ACO22_07226 [Paracoccidioides brasiliensis]|uniref:Uncharacterized protein n=1 Tax=Paracoccidioides brasiliensis TaxID=121759 RepID=A0A1D2J5A2_PARBR|nr:hypothetical protein ACO22_07226 [Paracoccidioides brasiliensis]
MESIRSTCRYSDASKKISWKCPRSDDDFMSLGNAIQPSLHQLQGLDLDLLDYIPEIEGRRFRSGRKQFLPRKPFDVWRAVLCHKSTLKKFVQYQKGLREIPYNTGPDATVLFNRNRDTVGIGESLDDTAFVEFDLECLDLCCNVEDLIRYSSILDTIKT